MLLTGSCERFGQEKDPVTGSSPLSQGLGLNPAADPAVTLPGIFQSIATSTILLVVILPNLLIESRHRKMHQTLWRPAEYEQVLFQTSSGSVFHPVSFYRRSFGTDI
ncbi:hypothetical protein [Roseovarius aestuariivivens]|uniref:hypothetical protein n=1 Tax=Roseovarius aestuariivivens TaxID=1888910 RepID=UPI0014369FDC|nr:hypothetical protein [Roseovarius aestuariivivens]